MAPDGLDTVMLRRVRRSPVVRAVLCAAGLMTLTMAFGLHPEPSGDSSTPASLGISASASVEAPAHDCIACLTASSVLVAALSTDVPVSADSTKAEFFGDIRQAPLPVCSRSSGRAPPPRSA